MACIVRRRGRWVIDFKDHTGARRWKTLRKGLKKEAAEEEMVRLLEQVRTQTYLSKSEIPTFAKVAEDWLKYKKPKIRKTYWDILKGHIKNHFADLNHFRINQITIPVLERFITDRQEKKMHIATLRKVLVTLGQILAYAVKNRYLSSNPLRDTERPRDVRHEGREMQILTPDKIPAFLEAVTDRRYHILFLMAVMTGARQGELLGLKWADLDLETKQVYIQRTFTKGQFYPTKTKGSKRKIDLAPLLVSELRKWKLACPKTELDLMFPNEAGEPMNYSNMVQRFFLPALAKAEIVKIDEKTKKVVGPKVRFHDLRHTYASLMIEQGENVKYIQTQLGHSSPMVTLNVYTHLMKPTNQEAVQRLQNTIFQNFGSKMVAEKEKDLTANG